MFLKLHPAFTGTVNGEGKATMTDRAFQSVTDRNIKTIVGGTKVVLQQMKSSVFSNKQVNHMQIIRNSKLVSA